MKQYFGPQTEKSLENFPYPVPIVSRELIYAITEIKKAAAQTHKEIGALPLAITDAIVRVCDEILAGKHDSQFVTRSLQGGAGTSINMNVNEVIATRATELLHNSITVHPNDHVNGHQSTNDVNPSALRIVSIRLGHELVEAVDALVHSLHELAKKYRKVRKLGRTHIQDAVPTTFGEEFTSWSDIIERDSTRIIQAIGFLYDLNLGGTAIGNSVNIPQDFIQPFYKHIQQITGIAIKPARNMMALTSSTTDFAHLSAAIHGLSIDLSKIASDIRFLSSGPSGGIGEIHLPELQAGSSIMPGKVNPVIPESINQVYYCISGKHLAICQASADAHLELSIMFPVIADALINELKIMISAVTLFREKCIEILVVDEKQCAELLEKSTAYATLFTKKLGYDNVSALVKESVQTGKTFHRLIIEKNLVTEDEFQTIISSH